MIDFLSGIPYCKDCLVDAAIVLENFFVNHPFLLRRGPDFWIMEFGLSLILKY